jgi:hypothetical protein
MISIGCRALITRISSVMAGTEAREIHSVGPNPTAPGRHCAAIFRFAAMFVFLVLSACTKAPTPEPRASLPAQRNLASPAPTPCTIPNTGQTDTPNVLNSPQPSDTDRLKVECLRGVPPPRTTWSWSGPSWVAPEPPQPDRANAERQREEAIAFQTRQRSRR